MNRSLVDNVISSGNARIESEMDQQVGAHAWIDKQTGFVTRSAMCVPVRGAPEEHTTGAIEVLNKKRFNTFVDEERQLLVKLAFQFQTNI